MSFIFWKAFYGFPIQRYVQSMYYTLFRRCVFIVARSLTAIYYFRKRWHWSNPKRILCDVQNELLFIKCSNILCFRCFRTVSGVSISLVPWHFLLVVLKYGFDLLILNTSGRSSRTALLFLVTHFRGQKIYTGPPKKFAANGKIHQQWPALQEQLN